MLMAILKINLIIGLDKKLQICNNRKASTSPARIMATGGKGWM